MRAATIHSPGDIRLTDVPRPVLSAPTEAIVRVVAGSICGSDLWRYRGIREITPGTTVGHECVGVVEEIGRDVQKFRPGDFVIVPFVHCDNSCAHCRAGVHSACVNAGNTRSGQAEYAVATQADGSLMKTESMPDADLVPSLLTLTDVMATGWHAAVSAGVRPGATAVVVGDGAVGLCAVIAAVQLGAEKVVAMSRHQPRQQLALAFGATHVVAGRGNDATAAIKEITDGVGADAVLECVGTDQSMATALDAARPGSTVGYVGAGHGVELPVRRMFERNVGLAGGMAPVRRYLPELLKLVLAGTIDPGRVFDLILPLDKVAEGYRAMDERRAIKVMLQP